MRELGYTIVYNSKLIRRAEAYFNKLKYHTFPSFIPAMVWDGNTVHVRGNYISSTMLNHELIHLAQIDRLGNFRKYLDKYFIEEKELPYDKKSSEVEAYANEWDYTYITREYDVLPVCINEIHEQTEFTPSSGVSRGEPWLQPGEVKDFSHPTY